MSSLEQWLCFGRRPSFFAKATEDRSSFAEAWRDIQRAFSVRDGFGVGKQEIFKSLQRLHCWVF